MKVMQSRAGKDAKTVAIGRALALFVVVLLAAGLAMFLASKAGVHATDAWFRVAVAGAALLAVVSLARHRD
jgi:cobalamin biosynthesis protein CobD/CbiB